MATKFKCNDGIYTVLRNGKAVAIGATAGEAVEAIAADAEEIACPPEPPAPLGLRLTYTPGNLPANNLAAWNTFFDLPANGTPFTDVSVAGDEVTLYGGAGITLKASLFRNSATLLKIEDDVDCVVAIAGGKNAGAISLCPALTTVTLNGVTTVGQEGLYTNAALTTLNMNALTTAGVAAFQACASMVVFSLPSLTTAGGSCFSNNTSVTTFTLPSLTTAGASCFSGNTSVTTYTLPSLTTAEGSCFSGNTSATTYTLPSLTTAGDNLFDACINLTTVAMASCTDLGGTTGNDGVFSGCVALTSVTVPTALATVDAGNPDGDLVYADVTLGATINYI